MSTHIKTFENFIKESADNEIVFFPGRFQPFHKGHLNALKRTSDIFNRKVIPVQILTKNVESPFPEEILKRMSEDVLKNNSFIKDFVIYPKENKIVIPHMVRYLRNFGYEPVGLGAGADRIRDYQKQVEYIIGPNSDTPVVNNFSVRLVDDRTDGYSGKKVRESLENDDREMYCNLMPKELHKYFEELKNML